jgi:hypothetical protein
MRLLFLAFALVSMTAGRVRACGGGLVTTRESAGVGANVQRVFLAPSASATTVITQVAVPATTDDYGVLIPLPAQPTLDPRPVPSADFDALDAATAPAIVHAGTSSSSGGFGLGCGGGASKAGSPGSRVTASPPVEIGPVTAVTLTADDGSAVNDWLAANGFVLPADGRPLVDTYAGPGRFFVAIKRSSRASDGAPSSVGVRFTVPGDQRTLPLRFARLGAADRVAFTVFVAADVPAGPEAPFAAMTLDQLSPTIAARSYPDAVALAVSQHQGRAFVVESVRGRPALPASNALLEGLSAPLVTRLSTIIDRAALNTDASLAGPAPTIVPDSLTVPAQAAAGVAALLALAALVGARLGRRVWGIVKGCKARGA